MENSRIYKARILRNTKKTSLYKTVPLAFLSGGALCTVGELYAGWLISLGITKSEAYLWVTVTVIFLSSFLTALGVFDKIARYVGCGLSVPVSGFANSVTSSALDARHEGLVMGIGAGIFSVAGPVILYATVFSSLYGVIYLILKTLGVM